MMNRKIWDIARLMLCVFLMLPAVEAMGAATETSGNGMRGAEYMIPFERSPGGIIIVDVLFNGETNAKMVFDTGASIIVISEGFEKKLRLSPLPWGGKSVTMKTAGGDVQGSLVTIPQVELGNAVGANVVAAVSPVSKAFEGFDGLLGLSFLGDFKITIDYRNRIIVLKENRAHP